MITDFYSNVKEREWIKIDNLFLYFYLFFFFSFLQYCTVMYGSVIGYESN